MIFSSISNEKSFISGILSAKCFTISLTSFICPATTRRLSAIRFLKPISVLAIYRFWLASDRNFSGYIHSSRNSAGICAGRIQPCSCATARVLNISGLHTAICPMQLSLFVQFPHTFSDISFIILRISWLFIPYLSSVCFINAFESLLNASENSSRRRRIISCTPFFSLGGFSPLRPSFLRNDTGTHKNAIPDKIIAFIVPCSILLPSSR